MSSQPPEFEEPDVPPIARLPLEVLSDIFLLTLPALAPSTIWPPVVGPRWTSPWSLDQVCSQWRVLALSLSALWARLIIRTAMTAIDLHLLAIQLERSGQAPLHLLFKCSDIPWRSQGQEYTVFLQTLVGECHRWRTIWLELDSVYTPMHMAAFKTLGPLTLLTELRLSGEYTRFIPSFDVFDHAPNLRRVILGHNSVPHIPLPWRQITTYKATYLHATTHLANLSAAAATLVECDIDIEESNIPATPWHNSTFTLPRLRRLAVREHLLAGLSAPALRELYVASSSSAHSITGFIVRSTCALTRLTLVQCAAPAAEIVNVLRHTPALAVLEIQYCGSSGTPNEVLAALAGVGGLVPALAALSWADFTDSTDCAALADMVAARWRATRRLRFVAVYTRQLRMKANGLRLRALMSEGVDVVILRGEKGQAAIERWREY